MNPTQAEIWQVVLALNRAWTTEADMDRLAGCFHRDAVAVTPMDRHRLAGREACVASWRRFVESATAIEWRVRDPDVRIFAAGQAAVVTYYYDITFRARATGLLVEEQGRDMFFLVREDDRWLVVADQFSSFPAARGDEEGNP